MKKLFLFVFSLSCGLVVSAQNITLQDVNGNNITNLTVPVSDLVSYHVHVSNNSQANMPVKLKIKEVTQPSGTNVEFCWTVCVADPRAGFEFDAINIGPGTTNTSAFHIMYYANQVNEPASFTVLFFSSENPTDTAQITFSYTPSGVAADELFKTGIYPNPATDKLFVESVYTITGLSVYTVQGKKVLQCPGNSADISELSCGIYFVAIKIPDRIILKKFVKTGF